MQVTPTQPSTDTLRKSPVSFWRKLGGGSLSISLLIHAVVLVIGVVVVVQIIPPPADKIVDFIAPGGGGPPPSNSQQKKRANVVRSNVSRVAARDVVSNFTLPEPDASADMSALGALSASGMGGLGGLGSGGGNGSGTGTGIGAGMGAGLGSGSGANPFGMIDPNANALVGTFYDIKQTHKNEPTGIEAGQIPGIIREFINGGWKDRDLEKYYQSPQKLYQTKVYIQVAATAAPAAFNCPEVEPSRWIVVYRGTVTPPVTGKYRFVGAADDVMVVRFNRKNVFDHGYTSGTTGVSLASEAVQAVIKGESKDTEILNQLGKAYPMPMPVEFYKYESLPGITSAIGGFAQGEEFYAVAGTAYPIEILLSEIPGGGFYADLLIEQMGQKYITTQGTPILPLFRTDSDFPKPDKENPGPPFDKKGPIWKIIKGLGKSEI